MSSGLLEDLKDIPAEDEAAEPTVGRALIGRVHGLHSDATMTPMVRGLAVFYPPTLRIQHRLKNHPLSPFLVS